MMKRTIAIILALLLALSCLALTGCGKGKDVSGIGTVELNDKPGEGEGGGVGKLGGSDDTPQDDSTPAPQSPGGVTTERYDDGTLSMNIPKGWTVQYSSDANEMYYVKVYDPSNTSFCIMYYGAYEPLFPSAESKQLWTEQGNSVYAAAPVVTEPTAEQMLLHWKDCAAMVDAYQLAVSLPSISGVNVIDSGTYEGALKQYGATESEVVGTCTSGKGVESGAYLCTAMILTDPQAIAGKDTRYYSAYNTYFIMAPQESWEGCYDTLKACLESMATKNASAGAGLTAPTSGIQAF